MSEYTPTTDEVRAVWREWNGYGGLIDRTGPEPTTRAGMVAEFDRWLDQVKAAARREGQAEAWDRAESAAWDAHKQDHHEPWSHMPNNPYRNGADQ